MTTRPTPHRRLPGTADPVMAPMAPSVPRPDGGAQRQASVTWILATLSLSMLLSSLGTSIANVGLPTLALAFGASFEQVQWIVLTYLLAVTTLVVGAGRLGDLVGRRRLLLGGIGVFTLASLLCGLAPTLGLLIAARGLQGAGAATMMALTMAFVAETVPKARTGRAMGLLGTVSAVGTALGPSLGGLLIAGFGWPALFFATVPLGLVTLVLVHRCLPAERRRASNGTAGFDVAGTVVLIVLLAAYALAMTTGRGNFGGLNIAFLLGAALGVGVFALVEARVASPLVRPAMFRAPVLAAGFAMSALVTTVVMATLVVGPFYLSGALALDAAGVGLVMSSGPAVAAVLGVPAGRLVDRFGARRTLLVGLGAMTAGAAMLTAVPTDLGVPGYVVPLAVITAGYATFQAANNTAVMAEAGPDQRGVVSGLLNLSRNLGLITGASAMGAVFAHGAASAHVATASAAAVTAGMHATLAVATVLTFGALAIAIVSGLRRPARPPRIPGSPPSEPNDPP